MSAINDFFAHLIGDGEIENLHGQVWVRKGEPLAGESAYVVEVEFEVGVSQSPFLEKPEIPVTPVSPVFYGRSEPDPMAHDEDEEEDAFFNQMEALRAEEE